MKDFAQSTRAAFESNFTVGVGAVYRLLNQIVDPLINYRGPGF